MSRKPFIRRMRGDPGSLRARSIESAMWTLTGLGMQRGLSLASNLIMTRLLVPDAFGLMAIVLTVHTMVNMMSDIGIQQSIVRSEQGGDLHYLQAAWSVQIVRSMLIAGMALGFALAIGALGPRLAAPDSVYADPSLPWLIAVSSLTIVFRGLESTAMALAARKLALRKVTIIETLNQAITIGIMVLLAQIEATVWVLLWGMMIGAAQRLIWTHVAFRETPMRWVWDRGIAADMWTYGRWLIGASLAGFVINQGDRFVMGALLEKSTFGLYTIAALWVQAAMMFINQFMSRVYFSALAETLRDRPARFPRLFRLARRVLDATLLLAFVGSLYLGPWFIDLFYPAAYAGAGAFITLLGFRFLARRQMALATYLLAVGNSRAMAISLWLSAAAIIVGTPLVDHFFGTRAAVVFLALAPMSGGALLVARVRGTAVPVDWRGEGAVMLATITLAAAYLWWF